MASPVALTPTPANPPGLEHELLSDLLLANALLRNVDIHRARAAEIFGVPPAEVTLGQRQFAKLDNYTRLYR